MSLFFDRILKNKYNLLMLAGFIAGSLIANILHKMNQNVFNYDYEALLNMLNTGLEKQVVFCYIFKNRIKDFFILILLMMAPFHFVVPVVLIFALGLNFGIVLSSMIANWGIKGVALFCASILPHYIIYIITALFVIDAFRYKNTKRTVSWIILGLFVLTAGCYFESVINPYIVRFVLNKLCDVI